MLQQRSLKYFSEPKRKLATATHKGSHARFHIFWHQDRTSQANRPRAVGGTAWGIRISVFGAAPVGDGACTDAAGANVTGLSP
jgi:hypothetical protein